MKLLIIEKHRELLKALSRLLTHGGHDAEAVFDGALGLERLLNGAFDAVIFGEDIPRISAEEICSQAKEKGISPITISLYSREEELSSLLTENEFFDEFLRLPFLPEELLSLLSSLEEMKKREEEGAGELKINFSDFTFSRGEQSAKGTKSELWLLSALLKEGKVEKKAAKEILLKEEETLSFAVNSVNEKLKRLGVKKKIEETSFAYEVRDD